MTDYTEAGFDQFLERSLAVSAPLPFEDGSIEAPLLKGDSVRTTTIKNVVVSEAKLYPQFLSGSFSVTYSSPVYVDANGYIYLTLYVCEGSGFGGVSIKVYRSTNSGATWSLLGEAISLSGYTTLYSDRISLAVDSNGLVGVLFKAKDTTNYPNCENLFFSLYNGSSFNTPQAVSTGNNSNYTYALPTNLRVDTDNRWHVSWMWKTPEYPTIPSVFYNSRSADTGGAWNTMANLDVQAWYGVESPLGAAPQLIMDSNNYPHILVADYANDQLREMTNKTGSWVSNISSYRFIYPEYITIDTSDTIYISDSGSASTAVIAVNSGGAWSDFALVSTTNQCQLTIYGSNSVYLLEGDDLASTWKVHKYNRSNDTWTTYTVYSEVAPSVLWVLIQRRLTSPKYLEFKEGKYTLETFPSITYA